LGPGTIQIESQSSVVQQFGLPLSPKMVLPIHNRRPALLHHLVQPIFVARKTIRQTKHADSKLME